MRLGQGRLSANSISYYIIKVIAYEYPTPAFTFCNIYITAAVIKIAHYLLQRNHTNLDNCTGIEESIQSLP